VGNSKSMGDSRGAGRQRPLFASSDLRIVRWQKLGMRAAELRKYLMRAGMGAAVV